MPSWGGDLVKFSVLKFFPRKGCCLQITRQVLLVDTYTRPQLILETFQNSPFFTFHAVVLRGGAYSWWTSWWRGDTTHNKNDIIYMVLGQVQRKKTRGCFFFLEKSIFSAFFSTQSLTEAEASFSSCRVINARLQVGNIWQKNVWKEINLLLEVVFFVFFCGLTK